MKIYLASPYGFTSSGTEFMNNVVIPSLQKKDIIILNPWRDLNKIQKKVNNIHKMNSKLQIVKLKELNDNIAQKNADDIENSDMIIAVLDGSDVDSGVSAEIGYAYALNKKIYGYRSDFRLTGDNLGCKINLQVEYFINQSGGKIFDSLQGLQTVLKTSKSKQ